MAWVDVESYVSASPDIIAKYGSDTILKVFIECSPSFVLLRNFIECSQNMYGVAGTE